MLQTKVSGTLDGLTRKISKGIETMSFKITVGSPKEWDHLKEFVDQDVSVTIAARQGALRLEDRSKRIAKPKSAAPKPPEDGASA